MAIPGHVLFHPVLLYSVLFHHVLVVILDRGPAHALE
jgi:hypothetical protein